MLHLLPRPWRRSENCNRIGVRPEVNIAAAYQAAYGVDDEMQITNPLLEGKLMLSRTRYSQLYVPSHTEIVLEGRILNDKTHEEWMVEMLRTHDFKHKQPVFELERIMLRNDAIYLIFCLAMPSIVY